MMPAQIIAQVIEEGGEIRLEDGRLKVKAIPARLVPAIREHKAALLALLSSSAPDDYDRQERAAIMEYDGELTRQEAERLAGVLTITHRDPNARFREAVESYPRHHPNPQRAAQRRYGPATSPSDRHLWAMRPVPAGHHEDGDRCLFSDHERIAAKGATRVSGRLPDGPASLS